MISYAERYLGTVLNNSEFEPLKNRLIEGKTDSNSGKKGSKVETKIPKENKLLKVIEPLTEKEPPLERFVELIRVENEKTGRKGKGRVGKKRRREEQRSGTNKKPRTEAEKKKVFDLEQPLLDILVKQCDFDEEDLDCIRAMKLKEKDLLYLDKEDLISVPVGPRKRLLRWITGKKEEMEEDG